MTNVINCGVVLLKTLIDTALKAAESLWLDLCEFIT